MHKGMLPYHEKANENMNWIFVNVNVKKINFTNIIETYILDEALCADHR